MSERRRALLAKFKATAADRMRRMSLALIDLEEGRGSAGHVHEVARELHTLKGECNILGLAALGAAMHAAEAALHAGGAETPGAGASALVRRAFDVALRALDRDPPGADTDGAIAAITTELAAVAEPAPAASSPSIVPRPAPSDLEASRRGPPSARSSSEARAAPQSADRWVQIAGARVDGLCEHVAGFAGDFRSLSRRLDALFRAASAGDATLTRGSLITAVRVAAEDLDRCRSRLDELHDAAWALRLSPVDPLLSDLARHAHQIAAAQGKRVRITTRSGGASLERALLDELWEPLLHVVRNAVDHGIEGPDERAGKPREATLSIAAETVGPNVVLSVEDDGRGIDPARLRAAAVRLGIFGAEAARAISDREALDLVFWHGFSTRESVSELSGRGVGLDVVRSRVEALGGSAEITSTVGHGTRTSLTIPATLSRERTLVVGASGALYGIPFRGIVEIVRADGITGPLRSLTTALDAPLDSDEPWAVILEAPRGPQVFAIPRVVGEFDLLRHPLDPLLSPLGYLGGSATLDDGRLVMILSIPGLVRRAEARPFAARSASAAAP